MPEADGAREAAEFEFRIARVAADAWESFRDKSLTSAERAKNGQFDTLRGFTRRALIAAAKAGYAEGVADHTEAGPF